MSTIGFTTLDVIPSMKGLSGELDKQTRGKFGPAGRKAGREYGDAAGKEAGERIKSGLGGALKDAVKPAAGLLAGAGIAAFFKGAISGASDLAETTSKLRVIFGEASGAVEKFAGDSTKNILLTTQEAEAAAASFGVFGKSAGLTGDELSSFSTRLVGLASDLSSFSNTSTEQAIESLGAALRGEAEPIRAYGVLLDDASLRQQAFAQGLIKSTKTALTPQNRVLAAYSLILKQTSDAQGDAERTQGGYANSVRKLQKSFTELQTEVGAKLLPALTDAVNFLNEKGVPALEGAGGAASDVAKAFSALPGPIKAAAGAFVALRVASAVGVFSALSTSVAFATTRAAFFSAAYSNARNSVFVFGQASGVASAQANRLTASLAGLRAASFGIGAAATRGLASATALVGGPWGAAFIAGTAVAFHFWQEQKNAKQEVDELTASLDKQTGALTKLSSASIFKSLLDSGAVDAAKELGINLGDLQKAAEGNDAAIGRVNSQLSEFVSTSHGLLGGRHVPDPLNLRDLFGDDQQEAANKIREALGDQHAKLTQSQQDWADQAQAMDKSATASKTTAGAMSDYSTALGKARDKVQALLDKENERRNKALTSRRDAIGLQAQIFESRKEAFDGARTLDITTEEGRKNSGALLDLADQWNNSADAVKNAKGAYIDIRVAFLQTAIQMGATKAEAKKLADELLGVPNIKAINVTTPGMKQAIEDAQKLKEALRSAQIIAGRIALNQGGRNRGELSSIRRAGGGPIYGPGTGTSDSILMWGSNGEFMQRKRAVDYYGLDFMRRLNNLQIPKFAGGGPVGGVSSTVTHGPGVNIERQTVVVPDVNAFLRDMDQRARMASSDGIRRT